MKDAVDSILQADQAAYLASLDAPRDELLARMEARAKERRYPISDPEVAAFIAITTRAARPKFIVELGTNIGYGAIVLARAAGEDARVLTVEYSAALCDEARSFIDEAGLSSRIEVKQAKAIDALLAVETPIDLLYVDCVKEEYPRYLEIALPKLSARGIVIADNVLWKGLTAKSEVPEGERARTEAIRAFNRAITRDPSLSAVVLPLGDGVAYAIKN